MKLQHLLRQARHFKRRSARMHTLSMGTGRRRYRQRRGGYIRAPKYYTPTTQPQRKSSSIFTTSNAVKALKVAGTLGALALGAKYGVPTSLLRMAGPRTAGPALRIDPKKLY